MPNEYWKEQSEKESAKAWMDADEMADAQMVTKGGTVFCVGWKQRPWAQVCWKEGVGWMRWQSYRERHI